MALRILAFSSSRAGNQPYLQTVAPALKAFLGAGSLSIAFVPFASADVDYTGYKNKVGEGLAGLPYTLTTVLPDGAKAVLEQSDVIMVGGGNTFKLLHDLYYYDLIGLIRRKVNGGTPYVGWSAGSNITGRTIGTTNDMPIIEPKSFTAFGFFPFQLNPHYYNLVVKDFHGETRDQRLEEYLKLNPGVPVVGLPEGTALQLESGRLHFDGTTAGVLMQRKNNQLVRTEIAPQADLSFLLEN